MKENLCSVMGKQTGLSTLTRQMAHLATSLVKEKATNLTFWCQRFSAWGIGSMQEFSQSHNHQWICCCRKIIAPLLPVEDRCNQGTEHSVKISVDFFGQCHNGVGKLGHPVATVHPCAFGSNERAGMKRT